MQIRVANRQDEPLIRTIVFQSLEECGLHPDLEGLDQDLRNVEQSYFWYDGLCVVAENEGQIVGVLAARRSKENEDVLEMQRLAVTPGLRRRGVAKALMNTLKFFAMNMEYKSVVISTPGRETALDKSNADAFKKLGFAREAEASAWTYQVAALKR